MALLSIYRGTQEEISKRPASDGALLFATDTARIYLDKGSDRIQMNSIHDLSDYVTSTQLSSSIEVEKSNRQKQDSLLQNDINKKLQSDDLVQGSNVTIDTDSQPGKVVVSAIDTKYNTATAETNGLMSTTDKEKLDGIATGANKYTLPTASSSTLGGVKTGANITNSSGTISLTKANVTAALGYIPPTKDTNTTYTLTQSGSKITLKGSDGSETSVTGSTLSALGVTATATELNYMDGVTNNVQTQLNSKAASSHSHPTATNSDAGFLRPLNGHITDFLRGDGIWAPIAVANNSVTLAKLGSDVGTVAVQSEIPSDSNVKLWIQI